MQKNERIVVKKNCKIKKTSDISMKLNFKDGLKKTNSIKIFTYSKPFYNDESCPLVKFWLFTVKFNTSPKQKIDKTSF